MAGKTNLSAEGADLRRSAEERLKSRRRKERPAQGGQRAGSGGRRAKVPGATGAARGSRAGADTQRQVHELQVHQIELEMQNAALQEARERMEALLENYTDLYDFAPVGYFSLGDRGLISEANLTGAALLGVERSRLMRRRFVHFVAPASQPVFEAFLKKVLTLSGKHVCEVALRNEGGATFWADLQALSAPSSRGPRKLCRVAISDISALKRADEAQRRMAAMTLSNRELKREIAQRLIVEEALKKSERDLSRLLEHSHHMQAQLRSLSRQMLQAQEDERKRISRELHDQIAQTLVGIHVHLEGLAQGATLNPAALSGKIERTQQLVAKSVKIVQQFARELRPALLDDLGLIPALHSYMNEFSKRTKIAVHLTAFVGVEQLGIARRTVLFRVAQSAFSNIARHANASRVNVSIHQIRNTVRMEIHDNGASFAVEKVLFAKGRKRLGLIGMKERVEMVGGSFSITSAPGHGTKICAQVPFAPRGGGASAKPASQEGQRPPQA